MSNTSLVFGFLALLVCGATGIATALVLYLRAGDWRESQVSRHLAAYLVVMLAMYVVSIMSMFIHNWIMTLVVFGGHITLDLLIWQRVVLIAKAQRE